MENINKLREMKEELERISDELFNEGGEKTIQAELIEDAIKNIRKVLIKSV